MRFVELAKQSSSPYLDAALVFHHVFKGRPLVVLRSDFDDVKRSAYSDARGPADCAGEEFVHFSFGGTTRKDDGKKMARLSEWNRGILGVKISAKYFSEVFVTMVTENCPKSARTSRLRRRRRDRTRLIVRVHHQRNTRVRRLRILHASGSIDPLGRGAIIAPGLSALAGACSTRRIGSSLLPINQTR